ncbi:MAG TPA: serine hydrolase domain-containing protein [Gemmatimonadales bacterium]|nr:serine hydrolase domain-containing protein [Gemmatimonadales bacterium]
MNRISLLLILAACGSQSASARLQKTESGSTAGIPIDSANLGRLLDSAMTQGMARDNIPGAAFILVKNGRVVLARGFGYADLESRRAWGPERTIFPIASITKVFTATAVMQLVDEGQIQLDGDVNRYLTSVQVPPTYPQPVTPAHLLSHTAGFDEIPGRQAASPREVIPLGRFLRNRLVRVHRPGELTGYSSYGAALAGLLVQDVSGLSFEDFLQRHIWRPLGMTRTSLRRPEAKDSAFATAYQLEDGKPHAIPYEVYHTPPTAAIVSTLADMARFMASHLHNGRRGTTRILSDTAAEKMHRQYVTMHPRVPGWTLGFQVNYLNGRRIIEHGGDIGGFSSLMTLLPDEGVGFLVVHHLEGGNLRFDIRQLILDRYFPDSIRPQPPRAQPASSEALRRFEGKYRPTIYCHSCRGSGPDFGEFEVTANEDGSISLWDERWFEVSPRYFVSADGRSRIGFAEDSAGRIFALTAGSWRVLERVH